MTDRNSTSELCPRFLSFVKKQNKNVANKDCLVLSVGVLMEVTVKNRGLHETGPPDLGLLEDWAWGSVSGLCLTLVQCLRDLQKAQSVVSISQTVGFER